MQKFEFLLQASPGPQEPAPGQHTPPTGAQLNLLGQRKKPGCIGHGGPEIAVNCVSGGITIVVPRRTVIITTGLAPSARGDARAALREANSTQSADAGSSVAFKIKY